MSTLQRNELLTQSEILEKETSPPPTKDANTAVSLIKKAVTAKK